MITTCGWIQPVDYHFSTSGQVDRMSVSFYSYPAVLSISSVCLALKLLLLLAEFPLGRIFLQLCVMEKPFINTFQWGLWGSPGLPQSQLRVSREPELSLDGTFSGTSAEQFRRDVGGQKAFPEISSLFYSSQPSLLPCYTENLSSPLPSSVLCPPLFFFFLAVLGLRCYMCAFSSCGEQGLLFVVVSGLLIVVASCCRARALGSQASVVVALGL